MALLNEDVRAAVFASQYQQSASAANAANTDTDDGIYRLRIVQNQESVGEGGSKALIIRAWLPDTFNLDVTSEYDTPFAGLTDKWRNSTLGTMYRAQTGNSMVAQDMTTLVWSGSSPWDFSIPFVFTADTSAVLDVVDQIRNLISLTTPGRNNYGFLTAPGPTLDVWEAAKGFIAYADAAASKAITDKATSVFNTFTNYLQDVSQMEASVYPNTSTETTKSASPKVDAQRSKDVDKAEMDKAVGQLSSKIKNRISLHVGKYMYFPAVVVTSVGKTYNTIFDAQGMPVRASVNVNFKTMMTPVKAELSTMFMSQSPPTA